MYNLYNEPLSYNVRKTLFPTLERYMEAHRKNISKVIHYYRNSVYAVPSNHVLVKLIHSLPSANSSTLREYRDLISDYSDDLTRVFKFTSPVNQGKVFYPGIFLGKDSYEVIVITEEDFDIDEFEVNWEDASPIRFLSHPKSDTALNVPNGKGYSEETGNSVILLNLPMLACQHRLWKQREMEQNEEHPRTTMQFLASHVLPNSISSFAEVAYLNIMVKLFNGEQPFNAQDNHPIFINNYFNKIVDGAGEVLYSYLNRNISFREFLEAAEGINNKTLRETIEMPKMLVTRQVVWPLVIARLEIISMMLLWNDRTRGHQNKKDINEVKRSIRSLRSDKNLEGLDSVKFSRAIREYVKEEIESYL